MGNLILKEIRIEKIKFRNNLPAGDNIQLEVNVSVKTDVSNDKHSCMGTMYLTIKPKESDGDENVGFELNISLKGIFISNDELEQGKNIQQAISSKLFSHMQAYLTVITSISGIPPIYLPDLSY